MSKTASSLDIEGLDRFYGEADSATWLRRTSVITRAEQVASQPRLLDNWYALAQFA